MYRKYVPKDEAQIGGNKYTGTQVRLKQERGRRKGKRARGGGRTGGGKRGGGEGSKEGGRGADAELVLSSRIP
jgi:hypothetical protein